MVTNRWLNRALCQECIEGRRYLSEIYYSLFYIIDIFSTVKQFLKFDRDHNHQEWQHPLHF